MEKRYIFYTGGWDSTYRLIELSRMGLEIQPIYCIDSGRDSKDIEIERIKEIIKSLENHAETKSVFLPLLCVEVDKIEPNEKITNAYKKICEKVKLGSQYDWLARLATKYPGIELGIEKPHGEYSGCIDAINTFGKLEEKDNSWRIKSDESSEECNLVFGNFSFPIMEKTEKDMVENLKELKVYDDTMKKIWFCHKPINGAPCGYCRPCQQKMECEMSFLLPQKSQKRYFKYKKLNKLFGNKAAKAILLVENKIKK